MEKNKTEWKKIKNKRKIYYLVFLSALLLFVSYSVWLPSSQILGRTVYKNQNSVALTFDDGPGADTETILNILKDNNVTATFFVICSNINETEISLIKRMAEDGNTVALHGYVHKKFQGYAELNSCKHILENITGKKVVYFRPPYGFKSPNTMFAAKKLNMTIITWSVFPRDYSAKSTEQIIRRVERNLKPNSIICFHDGPANREKTADALPEILRFINEKKYKVENFD